MSEEDDLTLAHKYRDLLDHWVEWWNGPGRENYRFPIAPPLTRTREVMGCMICQGITDPDGGRCEACQRKISTW